ncbi:MAG TPA: hydrogenase maturation nickel metallochaperone HypA [Opitutaceae bacterium]|nr:hydrogenase maturation nickel metallochaperone HypA [Opitutaceae bacterium]
MHELGIAENVLRAALREARSSNAAQVLRVVVRVGSLSGVDPESLHFAFAAIRGGTPAANATLEFDRVPAVGECRQCTATFPAEDEVYLGGCPRCGATAVSLRRGRELELVRVELAIS